MRSARGASRIGDHKQSGKAEPYDRGLLRDPEMPQAASRDPIYRRRRYSPELIEQCVRWYLTYRLSYRDLTAMMAEGEVTVG